VTPISAHGLLATIDEPTDWPVVHVSPEMVADLHEPRLIISPEYVGRDRRHGLVLRPRYAPARPSTHRLAQAVIVAVVTTVAVVPLTLMMAHGAPSTSIPAGVARSQVDPAAGSPSPRTPRVRPVRASKGPSPSASHQARSTDRAAAHAAQAAANADQRAARATRASSRAEQRSAAQAARSSRRAEAQAVRAARQASG
jgi:hypothetical protein